MEQGILEDRLLQQGHDQRQRSASSDPAELSLVAEIRPFDEKTTILGYGADDKPFDYECTFLGRYESTVNADMPDSWLVPESLHGPIEQQAVQLKTGDAAASFLAFLRSKKAVEILRAHGYGVPDDH